MATAAPAAQEFNAETRTWVDIPNEPPTETPVTPPAEPVAETKPVEPAAVEPKKAKPREDPEARIGQAIARQRDAERRAEAAERRAEERERELATLRTPKSAPTVSDDPEPDPADQQKYPEGQFDRQFIKDQTRWETRQEFKVKEAADREQHADNEQQRAIQTIGTKLKPLFQKAIEGDDTFKARVERLVEATPLSLLTHKQRQAINELPPQERADTLFRAHLADHWTDSDHPVELLEFLSDPAEFQRLATLPPTKVSRELAKLETRFGAASPPAPAPAASVPVSKAKSPIRPVETSAAVSDDEPGDNASDDEWFRWRQAHGKRRRA